MQENQSGGSLTQLLLIDLAIVYCTNSDFCLYNSSLSNTLLCMACICTSPNVSFFPSFHLVKCQAAEGPPKYIIPPKTKKNRS